MVKAAFEKFLCSKDIYLTKDHVSLSCVSNRVAQIVIYANMVWIESTNLDSDFPATHDVYLKLYHLSEPDLSKKYHVILFDECQDANDLQADIALSQKCIKIFVGDDHQQIYRWRYANNAMKKLIDGGADVMYLTKSFRFGEDIADLANSVLMYKHNICFSELMVLEGNGTRIGFDENIDTSNRTILHRTVYGTIETAIKTKAKVHWVGGINSYNISDLLDVYYLSIGNKSLIKNKQKMNEYKTYDDYILIADLTKDHEMVRAIRIINEYSDIDELVGNLNISSVNAVDADIIITTAHRAKGLEWDHIELAEDFQDVSDWHEVDREGNQKRPTEDIADELNLVYVGITRAKKTIKMSKSAMKVIQAAKSMEICE
jgi:superfamily I DNA/RNA helicase